MGATALVVGHVKCTFGVAQRAYFWTAVLELPPSLLGICRVAFESQKYATVDIPIAGNLLCGRGLGVTSIHALLRAGGMPKWAANPPQA